MPSQLTDKQTQFVDAVVRLGSWDAAARESGYAFPRSSAWRMRSEIPILSAIPEAARRHLALEAAPYCLYYVYAVARGELPPNRVRLDAAKTILDRAGYVAPKAQDPSDPFARPISEMTGAEVRRAAEKARDLLATYESAAADKAKPVVTVDQTTDPFDES